MARPPPDPRRPILGSHGSSNTNLNTTTTTNNYQSAPYGSTRSDANEQSPYFTRPVPEAPRRSDRRGGGPYVSDLHQQPSPSPSPSPYAAGSPYTSPREPLRSMTPTGRPQFQSDSQSFQQQSSSRNPSESQLQSRPSFHGTAGQRIEKSLKAINRDWAFLADEKCVPILVALKFMDTSSLGYAKKSSAFQKAGDELKAAMRQFVNEEHQGFNSSIGHYHAFHNTLQTGQAKLRSMRESLLSARQNLSTDKPELADLVKTSQNYDDMLMILNDIEDLKNIPQVLEATISEKRFMAAVDMLKSALVKIRRPEMLEIAALSDLHVYLSNQELALTDVLTEELHNHLYLKSPYCESRWKEHAPFHGIRSVNNSAQPTYVIGDRQLFRFLDQFDADTPLTRDTNGNPEVDTFAYIHLLVEALSSLARLESAVETLAQRLPLELFKVVEKTTNEIEQRYPASLRSGTAFANPLNFRDPARTAVLTDLFGTLYARFEAIAEGHRVVHEIITGITRRDTFQGSISSFTSGFRELWKLYQSEMRSLFHDYLSSNNDIFGRNGPVSTGQNVFKKAGRDKSKKLFKLGDMDSKTKDLVSEREDLQNILTNSVPGLASDFRKVVQVDTIDSTGNATDGSATGHRLLVDPNVFNMAILLPPSLKFISRLREIVPHNSDITVGSLTSFLDNFLANVFLPQLDDTAKEMTAQVLIDPTATSPDPAWAAVAKKPILKGTVRIYKLIESFCDMLDVLPHDATFSELLIREIINFYDKCYSWYKAMAIRPSLHPESKSSWRLSAELIERGDLRTVTSNIAQALRDENYTELELNVNREIGMLLGTMNATKIEDADLLDSRSISAMSILATSMQWLADKLTLLRFISTQEPSVAASRAAEDNRSTDTRYEQQRRWNLTKGLLRAEPDRIFLPLTEEIAPRFDAVQQSFAELSSKITHMLHIEMRTHVCFYLSKVLARPFELDREVHETDPEISLLTNDLIVFDENVASVPSRDFITTGLSALVDAVIVSAVTRITSMNALGCSKLQLAILVLQQNLKNIENGLGNASLSRSADFYGAFADGPDAIAALAKRTGHSGEYSETELKMLAQLAH